jgi:DNA-binding LacI/PurR family transcriptional regulator
MKPKRASTLSDVGKLARVSAGTVSRALAGNPRVSEATRACVLQAAEALHYAPNLAARRLSTGKTLSIAVIVPFLTRPSVSERLDGALRALAGTPYDLIIHNVATPEQRADCFKRFPHRRQVDGVLIISLAPSDDDVPRLQRADVPIVFIDADHPGLTEAHRIVVDDVAGGRLAIETPQRGSSISLAPASKARSTFTRSMTVTGLLEGARGRPLALPSSTTRGGARPAHAGWRWCNIP